MSPLLISLFVVVAAAAALLAAALAWSLRARLAELSANRGEQERALREELSTVRRESAEQARAQRQELLQVIAELGRTQAAQAAALNETVSGRLGTFARELEGFNQRVSQGLQQFQLDARAGREESAGSLQRFGERLTQQLAQLTEANSQRMNELRGAVEQKLKDLQADNAAKLEAMRQTVDEKLHATLEQRLGESFKHVAERLEQVHRGLGEMQTLAAGVGDLKRVLTNVKTRGTWGEVQLQGLLEQLFTPEQYAKNVATVPGSAERVEFALRLPGREAKDAPVWLPIDAKFPREDYERLIEAQEQADPAAAETAARDLERRVRDEARTIRSKYLAPPHTTDFAVLFLPTEGLYAEVLRRPGLADTLQRECRVVIAGPTTLTALLNSLQMGFRTLAIEKRSSEVWQLLGAVKTEFGKFGDVLDKVKEKLDQASKTIDSAGVRTRAIERRLRGVEALPAEGGAPAQAAAGLDDAEHGAS